MLTLGQMRTVEKSRRTYGQDPYGPLCSDHHFRDSCYHEGGLEERTASDGNGGSGFIRDIYGNSWVFDDFLVGEDAHFLVDPQTGGPISTSPHWNRAAIHNPYKTHAQGLVQKL